MARTCADEIAVPPVPHTAPRPAQLMAIASMSPSTTTTCFNEWRRPIDRGLKNGGRLVSLRYKYRGSTSPMARAAIVAIRPYSSRQGMSRRPRHRGSFRPAVARSLPERRSRSVSSLGAYTPKPRRTSSAGSSCRPRFARYRTAAAPAATVSASEDAATNASSRSPRDVWPSSWRDRVLSSIPARSASCWTSCTNLGPRATSPPLRKATTDP